MGKENVNKTNLEARIDVAIEQIKQLREDVNEIKIKLDSNYITRYEFDPIKKLVYGLVSIVLTGVVGAILSLIIIK